MAVAKSYEEMEQVGEPYVDNGKLYVKVRGKCPRCGGSGHYSWNQMDGSRCYGCSGSGRVLMPVRWYTDAERARQDRAAEKRAAHRAEVQEQQRIRFSARNAFGFGDAGYITLLRGDNEVIKNWVHEVEPGRAWFNMLFKWFVPSHREIEELPEGISTIRLDWDLVRNPNDPEGLTMIHDDEVVRIVNKIAAEPSYSKYQGNIGEYIIKNVEVKRNLSFENRYGTTHMHIMEDEERNVYVWNSSSKNLAEGKKFTLKMKVKEHKEYNNVEQTVVWYCRVMKEN